MKISRLAKSKSVHPSTGSQETAFPAHALPRVCEAYLAQDELIYFFYGVSFRENHGVTHFSVSMMKYTYQALIQKPDQ
ncbi:hypothetical protein [Candidatus Nitrotoga sp. 1052]|uniref:hypothetical protein n=1 Tax=Candidatus Nitrotoga sp. 1052 TaxID=2886964 RepID=UPI001EF45A32|nr:hypothetical protein [Candidatus Nitrotoga sp. 1052]CAH1070395.1 hypothetical protein NTG1052_140121 [Candidatus Nitrotoga sp. 1052]